jgi:hypothetical protein
VTSHRHRLFFADLLRRVTAGGCAALMLLLVTLAASPGLHERIHGADKVGTEDGCAVVLFANGVSLAAGTFALPATETGPAEQPIAAAEKLFLVPSRYLHQPERGPPAS